MVVLPDATIHVGCSPVRAVFLKTYGRGISSSLLDPGGGIAHAEFDLKRLRENYERYFRIEVVDPNGEIASANPCFLSYL